MKTLGQETLILLSAASFICKAWRLAPWPVPNPGQPLGQLPCATSSQGRNNLGRGTGLVHHSTAAHSMRKSVTRMRKTNVFVAWESCTVKHSTITCPCPAHGKVSFGSAWGACTARVLAGKLWDSYGTSMLPPALAFLSPQPHGLRTDRQVGFFQISHSTNAHRGMSPKGSLKRAADSSVPREAVPRTAAYVVGKISLFLPTPAQHPLFSKMIPPASTDSKSNCLESRSSRDGHLPGSQPDPPESSSGYRARP